MLFQNTMRVHDLEDKFCSVENVLVKNLDILEALLDKVLRDVMDL